MQLKIKTFKSGNQQVHLQTVSHMSELIIVTINNKFLKIFYSMSNGPSQRWELVHPYRRDEHDPNMRIDMKKEM